MDEQECLEMLKDLRKHCCDPEICHRLADDVLLGFLESLGYQEIVAEFKYLDDLCPFLYS